MLPSHLGLLLFISTLFNQVWQVARHWNEVILVFDVLNLLNDPLLLKFAFIRHFLRLQIARKLLLRL